MDILANSLKRELFLYKEKDCGFLKIYLIIILYDVVVYSI